MRKYVPSQVKLIPEKAERKFAGEIFEVWQWPQEMFDGSVATFEMLKRADTVIVIAVKDGRVVVTRQKQPRKDWYYDFPGGRVDDADLDELAAAKRELREETGMTFRKWKLVNVTQPFAKMEWLVYTFLATDFLEQGAQKLDAGEKIEIVEMSFEDLVECTERANSRDLRVSFEGLGKIRSLRELLELPGLYEY